jgi:hypothetical protein
LLGGRKRVPFCGLNALLQQEMMQVGPEIVVKFERLREDQNTGQKGDRHG